MVYRADLNLCLPYQHQINVSDKPTHPIIHENNTENRDLTLRIELTLKREMQIDTNIKYVEYMSIPKYIVNIVSILIFSLLLHVNSHIYFSIDR